MSRIDQIGPRICFQPHDEGNIGGASVDTAQAVVPLRDRVVTPHKPLKVLFVDDEPDIIEILSEGFTASGHEVETAADGQEGLEKFQRGEFDLVVIDQVMPIMNGSELAEKIDKDPKRTKTSVIMLTGHPEKVRRGAKVDIVLSKPISLASLRKVALATCGSISPLKILVVDDEILIREVTGQFLEIDGHTVETAEDGDIGLEKFRNGCFDIVFTDQRMPKMTGSELATRIKEINRDVIVIAISGTSEEVVQKTNDRGEPIVDAILGKPVTWRQVRGAIARSVFLS